MEHRTAAKEILLSALEPCTVLLQIGHLSVTPIHFFNNFLFIHSFTTAGKQAAATSHRTSIRWGNGESPIYPAPYHFEAPML